MATTAECKPFKRRMYDWEIQEARRIFADQLNYNAVRIYECVTWPNRIDNVGRQLKRMPKVKAQNAVTLGNHCYFPIRLPEKLVQVGEPDHYKLCWLIHELTHCWQYQHQGWIYIVRALSAQFREKEAAYHFGHEEGLKKRRSDGWTVYKFNLEQQGDITRSYYERLCRGEDTSEWLPYIKDIQKVA